jgi:hypothetical protein
VGFFIGLSPCFVNRDFEFSQNALSRREFYFWAGGMSKGIEKSGDLNFVLIA